MSFASALSAAAMHPVEETLGISFSPILIALVGGALVLAVAVAWPPSGAGDPGTAGPAEAADEDMRFHAWPGRLSALQIVTRAIAIGVLLLTAASARLGVDHPVENLAPALVVGVGWPLLVLGSALLGPVWRWLDPWDGMARLLSGRADHEAASVLEDKPASVWPAALVGVVWMWFLTTYPGSLYPRPIGTALVLYTTGTAAACLAFGRERWLSRVEVFGLLFGWIARLPRGRLVGWRPPPDADLVLGVLAGGLMLGLVKQSHLWGTRAFTRGDIVPVALVVLACALGAMAVRAATRLTAGGADPGAVAAAAVAPVASLAVVLAMANNRLFTSIQLLPGLIGDPFGLGWDFFGNPVDGLNLDPFGVSGRLWLQLGVLGLGHVAGAIVLARRLLRPARWAGAIALALLLSAAAAIVADV